LIAMANEAGIAIQAFPFTQVAEPTGDSRGMNKE